MSLSYFMQVCSFKSSLRTIAAFLLRSRATQKRRADDKAEEISRLRETIEQHERTIAKAKQERGETNLLVTQLKLEIERLRQQPLVLPPDPSLPDHRYGARMISLCINLARAIGLRPTIACLEIIFLWLGLDVQLPDWTNVRLWLMRAGVAALEEPVEPADDWIWMADHSNQIGPEKALVIVGLRAANMPPPGEALRHQDLRVLHVQPGVNWKREDMATVYQTLAAKIGNPLAVVVDGAVELREGAEVLQKEGKGTIVLGDFKHFAATVLKKVVGGSPTYAAFTAEVGKTRAAIQQTELGHLTPPTLRPKARFMNLASTLKWGAMVLWQLAQPHSKARSEITAERLNVKLGWLREYHAELTQWNACQDVVSASLTFINEQGLSRDTADRLAAELKLLATCDASGLVRDRLVDFVRQSEAKLTAGQRLPLSTEILESTFGLYKQLERQHSKGGFTSLLAAFGALLKPATPESIRRDFARVSVKQLRAWVASNLKTTLASKRKAAYAEFTKASAA